MRREKKERYGIQQCFMCQKTGKLMGRWKGTFVYVKKPVSDIRWKGLYDKNSDMQYAPRQLMPLSHYEQHFERTGKYRAQKFRKLMEGVKKKLIFKFFHN